MPISSGKSAETRVEGQGTRPPRRRPRGRTSATSTFRLFMVAFPSEGEIRKSRSIGRSVSVRRQGVVGGAANWAQKLRLVTDLRPGADLRGTLGGAGEKPVVVLAIGFVGGTAVDASIGEVSDTRPSRCALRNCGGRGAMRRNPGQTRRCSLGSSKFVRPALIHHLHHGGAGQSFLRFASALDPGVGVGVTLATLRFLHRFEPGVSHVAQFALGLTLARSSTPQSALSAAALASADVGVGRSLIRRLAWFSWRL